MLFTSDKIKNTNDKSFDTRIRHLFPRFFILFILVLLFHILTDFLLIHDTITKGKLTSLSFNIITFGIEIFIPLLITELIGKEIDSLTNEALDKVMKQIKTDKPLLFKIFKILRIIWLFAMVILGVLFIFIYFLIFIMKK